MSEHRGRSIWTTGRTWRAFSEQSEAKHNKRLSLYVCPVRHMEFDFELIAFTPEELAKQKQDWMREAFKAGGANICAIMIGAEDREDAFDIWFKQEGENK